MSLKLYVLKIKPGVRITLLKKLSVISQKGLQKYIHIFSETKKWPMITSDLSYFLIRKIIAHELKTPLDSLEISINPFGKPYLKNSTRQFNLSHSKNLIMLATDNTPVGIDLEYIQNLDDLDVLVKYFSDEEQRTLLTKEKKERLDFFYDLWTLKESYVKALGHGLSYPMCSFTIRIEKKTISLLESKKKNNIWHFKRYIPAKHYKCAVCAQHSNFPHKINVLQLEDLLT